jgi:hypothetical protein
MARTGGLLQDRSDIVEVFLSGKLIIWQRDGGINFNPGLFPANLRSNLSDLQT